MSRRCNIIIKKGDEEVLFYRHFDGHPSAIRGALLKGCSECNYDVMKVFKYLAGSGDYELSNFNHSDAEYKYLADFDRRQICAENLITKESLNQDEF